MSILNLSFPVEISNKEMRSDQVRKLKEFYLRNPEEFEIIMNVLMEFQPKDYPEYMQIRHAIGIYDKINVETLDIK